jgi:type V secretory pathway adhesin AidA
LENQKVCVLLHSQTEKATGWQRIGADINHSIFILIENKNLESQKIFLPLHSQSQTGLANGKKRACETAHTVTSNGSSTRSLNDGNRQNSKCLISFG